VKIYNNREIWKIWEKIERKMENLAKMEKFGKFEKKGRFEIILNSGKNLKKKIEFGKIKKFFQNWDFFFKTGNIWNNWEYWKKVENH